MKKQLLNFLGITTVLLAFISGCLCAWKITISGTIVIAALIYLGEGRKKPAHMITAVAFLIGCMYCIWLLWSTAWVCTNIYSYLSSPSLNKSSFWAINGGIFLILGVLIIVIVTSQIVSDLHKNKKVENQ